MAEKLVGQNIAPPDLVAKVTGRAKYSEDFRAEGMVFAKLLLSPMPHARVRGIDAREALSMPGVLGMLTAEDVPTPDAPGEACLTMEPLYEGEPVLAIAAVDETTAAEAIERVRVNFEPLPFVLDPLESLKPRGPNARTEGNVYNISRESREIATLKWTNGDFASLAEGKLPMGEPQIEWMLGDIDAGFSEADVVVEETIVHQSLTHHPMEPRSCMAYWQNGKVYIHGSTQSTVRSRVSMAGQLDMDVEDVVFVGEYCGGGFGSKISGSHFFQIPALLSRKINKPVMLRVTRYEENYLGRGRPGFQAWTRMGFKNDGRMTALDLYIVQDNGPYGRSSDFTTAADVASLSYQPPNMRFRGVSVFTNTPPRSAQRAPGGAQIVAMLEPVIDKAARQLGIDRVDIRKINAADNDGWVGRAQQPLTSAYVREALDRGRELFGWDERKVWSGQVRGTKVSGVGVSVSPFVGGSSGYDGLMLIRSDGKLYVHQGIGNLGTHSMADTARAAADVLGLPWDRVEVVWGDTSKHLPWSSVQAGSQTTHAHTRANHAAAMDAKQKLQEIAARDLGGSPGDYDVGNGRVFSRSNPSRAMSFAQAARRAVQLRGRYSGYELPEDIHRVTRSSAEGLAGEGLMGVAKDNYSHEGSTYSFVIGFAEVEVDIETGDVRIVDYTGVTDCGTVLHPRSLGAQLLGGSVQGFGQARSQKWVFDPKWGVAFAKRLYNARPPGILDVPLNMQWDAVGIPDPQTPVGAKGIGEPPVGAGAAAITSAVQDALGGNCPCRTPLSTDVILAALEGRAQPHGALEIHA